jgi:hypothetical protein
VQEGRESSGMGDESTGRGVRPLGNSSSLHAAVLLRWHLRASGQVRDGEAIMLELWSDSLKAGWMQKKGDSAGFVAKAVCRRPLSAQTRASGRAPREVFGAIRRCNDCRWGLPGKIGSSCSCGLNTVCPSERSGSVLLSYLHASPSLLHAHGHVHAPLSCSGPSFMRTWQARGRRARPIPDDRYYDGQDFCTRKQKGAIDLSRASEVCGGASPGSLARLHVP